MTKMYNYTRTIYWQPMSAFVRTPSPLCQGMSAFVRPTLFFLVCLVTIYLTPSSCMRKNAKQMVLICKTGHKLLNMFGKYPYSYPLNQFSQWCQHFPDPPSLYNCLVNGVHLVKKIQIHPVPP